MGNAEWDPRDHQHVAALDPLGAWSVLQHLPALNRRADVEGLTALLVQLCPPPTRAASWDRFEAAAAMRDLGLVLGSIRRFDRQPVEEAPAVEQTLLILGARCDLPPRDTLLHYTRWNPVSRLRTYTGLDAEARLIESIKLAVPSLERAIARLEVLYEIPVASVEFARRCEEIVADIAAVRDGLIYAYRFVSPKVFVDEIRPFFEPIEVGGQRYLGPGAVSMPLFLFDHILWGTWVEVPWYVAFKEGYLPYILPHLRQTYLRYCGRDALLDRVEKAMRISAHRHSVQARRNLEALDEIFRYLVRFRAPHLKLARGAYERPSSSFDRGSGGYAPATVAAMLELTQHARQRLRALYRPVHPMRPVRVPVDVTAFPASP